jgi:GT2 family glycosyltransferase/glycosyltransferase involved in cell wall biosynthesis
LTVTRVDLVIAAPCDVEALRRCLGTLSGQDNRTPYRVLVVPGAATPADVLAFAREQARLGAITLLPATERDGFAAAVNAAAACDEEGDVVVLDEHVVPHGDWLDRLAAHARTESHVGIVLPFSNAGGIAGHAPPAPRDVADVGRATAQTDSHFRRANAEVAVAVPLVQGPCLYITRACLDAAGRFDAGMLGTAAAAKMDFGLRASRAGFIALLAGDVFVGNTASVTESGSDLDADARYREVFGPIYADFHQRDIAHRFRNPAHVLARRADLLRLALSTRPIVVFVTHPWGGGIRRHMQDLARLIAPQVETLFLEPSRGGIVCLRWERPGESFELHFDLPDEMAVLTRVLAALPVARLHFHHVHRLPREVLDLPALTGLPYDCTLHDHFAICPQYHLVTVEGTYCGEPDAKGCAECLARRPAQWGLDIGEWRGVFERLLRGADRLIAPSRSVADRIARYFPGIAVNVWPNPEKPAQAAPAVVRVATIGTLSPSKGLRVVAACARDAAARDLPLAFRVLGATSEKVAQAPVIPLTISGEYAERDLPAILAAERPDVLLFAAQVPETYAYTLSAAIATGLPIVASDLGALPERLAGYAGATLMAWNAGPADWNGALLSAAGRADAIAIRPPPVAVGTEPHRYAAMYTAAIGDAEPRGEPGPALVAAGAHAFPPEDLGTSDELSLPELFRSGIECGFHEARAEFGRRVAAVDHQLAEFGGRLDALIADREAIAGELLQTQRNYLKLEETSEAALEAAHARIDALEQSTSWRITAPLRRLVHATRVGMLRARAGMAEVRQLPRRARIAASVLRHEGPRALGMRIARKLSGGSRFRAAPAPRFEQEVEIRPLAFTPAEVPRVSIVIPVYGKALLTYTCLKSVHANTPPGEFEVIVVDDASPEPIADALRAVEGIRIERNERNLGFIDSCNRGAALARGELLVVLNNDTIVTSGWLSALQAIFRDHADAGLAGAKLVYPDGRLQEAGGIVWRDGSAWNYGRDDDPAKPEYNYVREADYCSGACLAIPRALFLELGGFDARFAPAYYEDTDLAFAIRASGRKVFYQPAATVVHFEGQTSGTDVSAGTKRYQVRNQSAFRDKWSGVLGTHRANGIDAHLERDRWAKRRVLVIEACMLTPDQDAGSVRMQAIVELLTELSCKVTFVADNLEHREPYVSALQQRGVEVLFAPYVRSVSDVIVERGGEFDLAIVARHYIAVKHVDALRRFAPQALIAFDTVDLHFLRSERQAELEGGARASAAARVLREEELTLIRKADVTLVVSPIEQQVLAGLAPEARVLLLTNIYEPQPGGKPLSERQGLMFIGGFQHPPNTDAVLWYAREVLPLVRKALPGTTTYIVGSKVPATIQALAAPDFVVTGYAPDVTPFFTGCRASIAPLRYGAGVKGKVNYAMSYGLPVVATSSAIEGMQLHPGVDVLVADDAAGFAKAIVRACRDDVLWQRLSAGGVANVRRHFSRAVARNALTRLLALADARRPGRAGAELDVRRA